MKSTAAVCVLLLTALCPAGCGHASQEEAAECGALMDSARVRLQNNEFTRAVAGYTDACGLADRQGLDKEWFQAQMGLAQCYYRMGNNPEAYFLLSQAYEFAKNNLDERWQYFALGNMALIDHEQGELGIAKKYFTEINDWAEKVRDSVPQSTALGNLAELYSKTGDYREALKYVNQGLSLISTDRPNTFSRMLAVKVAVMCDSGAFIEASHLCDSLEKVIPNDREMRERTRLLRTRILLGTGSVQAALDTAHLVLNSADPLIRIETHELLADRAEASGDYKESLLHERKAAALRDSLAYVKLGATNKANLARLDLLRTRATIETKDRVIVWESIAIALMGILAIAGFLIGRQLIRDHRRRREQAERERVNAELQLQDSIKAEDTLKSEIDSKNRTLASKMMHITRRAEIIEDFMKFLSENAAGQTDREYKRRLMQFKAELKNSEDLENSMTYFENVNSGFLTRLREKHPELNPNDIRFLSYVYMQLNTKEIASLLNIAETSCKKRKQRLAAKMGLESASELTHYVSSI